MKRAIIFLVIAIILCSFPSQLLAQFGEVTVTITSMAIDMNRDLKDGYETAVADTFRYAELKYDEQDKPYYDYFGFQIKAKAEAHNVFSGKEMGIKKVSLQYFDRGSANWVDIMLSGNKGPAKLSYNVASNEWVGSFIGDDSLGKLIPYLKGKDQEIWLRVLALADDNISANRLDKGVKLRADVNPPEIISVYSGRKDNAGNKLTTVEKGGDIVDLWVKSKDITTGIGSVKFHCILSPNGASIPPDSNDWLDIGDGTKFESYGDEELWKYEWKTPKYMLNTDTYIIAVTVSDKAGNVVSTKSFNDSKRAVITSKTLLDASGLKNIINTRLYQRQQYPSYLLDTDSFSSSVNTIWLNFTDWITRKDLTDKYEELYWLGIEYDLMRFMALRSARDFLEKGDISNARKFLEKADTYEYMSYLSFQGASYVYEGNLGAAETMAQGIKDGCQTAVTFGLTFVNPTAAEVADWIYDVIDLGIEYYIGDEEKAVRDFIIKRAISFIFNEVPFKDLGGKTIAEWTESGTGKYLFPILNELTKSEEWQWALSKVIKEIVVDILENTLKNIITSITDTANKTINSLTVKLKSPAELRIYDSQGRITGLINGEVKNEIPMSVYDSETIIIFFPADTYRYEIAGEKEGKYGLEIILAKDADTIAFNAVKVPTSANAVHQYSIDWNVLSNNEGVTINIDSNGDGKSEETISSGANFRVNDPPTATSVSITTDEDVSVKITLIGIDPDNDPLTFKILSQPTNGTLEGVSPNFIYTPKLDFNGDDNFTFMANDGELDSNVGIIGIVVKPVNDPPVAVAQSITTDEDTPIKIILTGTDVDGDELTYQIVDQPLNGAISGTLPEVTYKPKQDFNGNDNFTFIVNDGKLESQPVKVDIQVKSVNDPPIAKEQSITIDENVSINIVLSASDSEGDAITFNITTQPSHGTISGSPPELIYKPSYGFGGEDSFTFVANDGKSDSAPMTIKIIINLIPNPVDINRDGIVNILDLLIIGKYYGKEDFPIDYNPDVNRDHKVDNKDFEIVQKNFGKKY